MKKNLQQSKHTFSYYLMWVLLPAIAVLCVATVILNNHSKINFATGGSNFEPEKKFVGSRDTSGFSADMDIYNSVEEALFFCDAVVIASFSEQPRNVRVVLPGDEYLKEEEIVEHYVTKYQLEVDTVIRGEIKERMLTLSQFGKYESNEYTTKLKLNTKYLIFLHERNYEKEFDETRAKEFNVFFENDKILYQLVGCESGIFEIRPDDTLYSYVDYGYGPSFDGKHYSELVKEIQAISEAKQQEDSLSQ